jgi:cytochrome b561
MEKYTFSMRAMHWIMAALLLVLVIVGFAMTGLPDEQKGYVYGLHKSFGLLALLFVILRIINRMRSEIPASPSEISAFYNKLSGGVMFLAYVCMVVMPISGPVMSWAFGHPVAFFGLQLPTLVEQNPELGKIAALVHEYMAFALIALVTLHVAGFLKHYFVERVNLLNRIW